MTGEEGEIMKEAFCQGLMAAADPFVHNSKYDFGE